MQRTFPPELEQAIRDRNLIVFAGAGLSVQLKNIKGDTIGGWRNLVEQILLHLKGKGYGVDPLISLLNVYHPIDVLNLIEKDSRLPRREVADFIKDFLDIQDDNDFDLHRKLYKLSSKIVTTNYDTAFEKAQRELRNNKAYKGKNYELTKHKDAGASLLFKLHGCFEQIDSLVLFPSSYDNLYKNPDRDAEHSILVLKNIILNRSILFIGAGMGDFQINNLFGEIKKLQGEYNQKHYIITKFPLDSRLDFLTPIHINDFSEIPEIINQLIKIREDALNEESEKEKALKQQLAEAEEKIKTLESEKKISEAQTLEKAALKSFVQGVSHSLSNRYEAAIEEYMISTRLKPVFHEALSNWGTALSDLAKMKQGAEAEKWFEQSFEKYRQAVEIKPDMHEAFYNWGTALSDLAKMKHGTEAEKWFEQSFEKYRQAVEIKPDMHEAFYNWGTALYDLAKMKQGTEAEKWLEQSFEKYRQAVEIKPNKHEAISNWGGALFELGKMKQGAEAKKWFEKSFEKYRQAVQIKPDFHEAFYNWGIALYELGKMKQGAEAEKWLEQSFEKYQKTADLGGRCYNLACSYALKNRREKALEYLQKSLAEEEITKIFVSEDNDWATFREDPEFLALLKAE